MLEVCRKLEMPKPREKDVNLNPDIIIKRMKWEEIVNEDGSITRKPVYEKVNITKKINETKKLIKKDAAVSKLAELEKILTKEN